MFYMAKIFIFFTGRAGLSFKSKCKEFPPPYEKHEPNPKHAENGLLYY